MKGKHLPSRADELLAALRTARAAWESGQTDSLTWARERAIILGEAESLGVVDEILDRMGKGWRGDR